jgi:predicted amidohydrolase YtcJ
MTAYAPSSQVGELRAGWCADLVILSRDPLARAPDALEACRVAATYAGGVCVWRGGLASENGSNGSTGRSEAE